MLKWLSKKFIKNPMQTFKRQQINGQWFAYSDSFDMLYSEMLDVEVSGESIYNLEKALERDELILSTMKAVLKDRKEIFKEVTND